MECALKKRRSPATPTIMGVHWDGSDPTALTRTGAAVGKSATASIGSTPGSSDFDTMPIYKDISRQTIHTDDVMVKIPKYYYRITTTSSSWDFEISDMPSPGFSVHPAFKKGSRVEIPYIYVAAYLTSYDGGAAVREPKSVTGQEPWHSVSMADVRTAVKDKGSGWQLFDAATKSAITLLYLIEFADLNSQEKIGDGVSNRTQAGAFVGEITGGCDAVPNLTGRPAGDTANVQMVYRGIEDLWGNIWQFVDGLIVKLDDSLKNYYVCNDPERYNDTDVSDYTQLSYGVMGLMPITDPLAQPPYGKSLGYDSNVPWAFLPNTSDNTEGDPNKYLCDQNPGTSLTSGLRCIMHGGTAAYAKGAGIFATTLAMYDMAPPFYGSRMVYIP